MQSKDFVQIIFNNKQSAFNAWIFMHWGFLAKITTVENLFDDNMENCIDTQSSLNNPIQGVLKHNLNYICWWVLIKDKLSWKVALFYLFWHFNVCYNKHVFEVFTLELVRWSKT